MNLSPLPIQKFFDNAGRPLNGGLLFTYVPATTTKLATYQDQAGTPNTNPIVLNFRGEANVWLDQTLTYKFVLAPEGDTDPPTRPIWSVDNISAAVTFASLTQQIIGQLLYPRTVAEIAAGITPVQYFYPEGVVDRYGVNTVQGTTDMTQAIKNAYAVTRQGAAKNTLVFLDEIYLVTDTCITILAADPKVTIVGVPLKSTILNKAGVGKPTIQLLGAQYWTIQGLVLIGATGFSNVGIQLLADGSANRCAYGTIDQIVCQTNGYGIRIQDTNTIAISNYSYWPSGGSAFGGSIDVNGQPGGILADGAGAVNSVYLTNLNISGLNTIANSGCGIKADGTGSGGNQFQDWKIDGLNCETGPVATRRALWMRNCQSWHFINVFTENMQVLIDSSSALMDICIQAGASGTLEVDDSAGACSKIHVHDSVGLSYTCDVGNLECSQENNSWQVAPGNADVSTNRSQLNTRTTGNTLQPDTIGVLGICEWNRSTPLGVWTTPTFSAADYTASAGNWTLTAPDVLNLQYTIVGKTLFINGNLDQTTVTAAPAQLTRVIPAAFVSAKAQQFGMTYTEDNGVTTKQGIILVSSGGANLGFRRDFAATAWAATANLTGIKFSIALEIQ